MPNRPDSTMPGGELMDWARRPNSGCRFVWSSSSSVGV